MITPIRINRIEPRRIEPNRIQVAGGAGAPVTPTATDFDEVRRRRRVKKDK